MAIVAPMFVTAEYAQALSLVVTIPTDTTGWTATFDLYDYEGQVTPSVSKTTSSGITNTPGASSSTMTIALTAANLTLPPGLRVWTLRRTNAGSEYPIVDRSGFLLTTSGAAPYPRLTNLANYLASLGMSQTAFSSDDTGAAQYLWALAVAEKAMSRACERSFTYASRVEYLTANWQKAIAARETPVESITSIYYDLGSRGGQHADDFAAGTLQTVADDYYLYRDRSGDHYSDSGLIYRSRGVWQGWSERPVGAIGIRRIPAVNVVKLTYTGGYGNAIRPPEDLLEGIHLAATLVRKAAPEGGRLWQSQSGEGHSVSVGRLEDEIQRLASTQWVIGNYGRLVVA